MTDSIPRPGDRLRIPGAGRLPLPGPMRAVLSGRFAVILSGELTQSLFHFLLSLYLCRYVHTIHIYV